MRGVQMLSKSELVWRDYAPSQYPRVCVPTDLLSLLARHTVTLEIWNDLMSTSTNGHVDRDSRWVAGVAELHVLKKLSGILQTLAYRHSFVTRSEVDSNIRAHL